MKGRAGREAQKKGKMAVEGTAAELLAQVKEVLNFESQTKEGLKSELPAHVLAEHAVNTRKTHKLMYCQLQVVKFLLDFLDSAPCIQDVSQSAVRKEVAEAKQQWKALKAEYQRMVEAIKDTVPQTVSKLGETQKRAQLLEEALQRYQNKKLEMEEKARNVQSRCQKEQEVLRERQQQLEERVAELQGRLQVQQKELQQLQGELEVQELQANEWREKMQRISDFRHLLETLQGVKLISATERDLVIELVSHSQLGISVPHHLELKLHWGDDGNVVLQSGSPFFPLSTVLPMGSCSTIKGIILELQSNYFQQARLLAEIESLQNCFAIDWQQEKRLLSYLKPTSTCSLYVEPGYPAVGQISLQAVKSHDGMVDVSSYKPPQERPSLKDWLEYLRTVDFGAPLKA